MSEFKSNKTASTFATVLIGIIILAFMFTGYQQFEGGGNVSSVATVDGMNIKPEEYQQEYNRQVEFYKQIMGGEVSAKQLESMRIKDMVIKNIVQRKLLVKFADELGTIPAENEVKDQIKALPYFQTNGQFDLTKYKGLLSANQLTPHEFEKDIINQLKMQKLQTTLATYPVSEGYLSDLNNIRKQEVSAEVLQINKNSLSNFINVNQDEINKFLAVETNAKRVESMFNEKKDALGKPEQIEAAHILLTTEGKDEAAVKTEIEKIAKEVTAQNFATLANKYTQDPSGSKNGGSLGTFGKGAMVPEFEAVAFTQAVGTVSAPVKTNFGYHLILVKNKIAAVTPALAQYRDQFAREIIQKDKVEDLKKLTIDVANQARAALEAGKTAEAKALAAKYKLSLNNSTINRLDGAEDGVFLSNDQMKAIFSGDLTKSNFHSFDDGTTMTMVRTQPASTTALAAEKDANDSSLKNVLSKKMMDTIVKELEAKAKVKVNNRIFEQL